MVIDLLVYTDSLGLYSSDPEQLHQRFNGDPLKINNASLADVFQCVVYYVTRQRQFEINI